ncbi:MAG: redoxin domain-containing protein [Chloroflexi bacterium]|nr:redoxin domain-containing protein [Chloroflexota bacterium]
MVSFARQYEELTSRNAMLIGISVDTTEENAAMVEKLRLPFPLLSDRDAAAAVAWDVYDAVGGTHGPIARPAIFVVGRDLTLPYEYVGRDFADRPPNRVVFEALDSVRDRPPRQLDRAVTAPGPRPLDAGSPSDKPMPLRDMAPYFRGASFGVQAIAGRTEDAAVKAECERFRAMVAEFMAAAVATWRMQPPM